MYEKIIKIIFFIFFINLFNNFAYSEAFIKNSNIFIPMVYGKIIDNFTASKKKIYIISDKHCDFLVQKNINFILKTIKNFHKNDFKIIGLEGTPFSEINTDVISNIKNKKHKNNIINFGLEKGLFSGAEVFKIDNSKNIKLIGLEDKNLYLDNFFKLIFSLENQEKNILIINKLLINYKFISKNFLSDKILNVKNLELDFLNEKISIEELIEKLKILNENEKFILFDKFTQINRVKNLLEEENKIDKNLLNLETKHFLKKIYKYLDKNEINQLEKYKNTENFYILLRKILIEKNINSINYQNLYNFINYTYEINNIDYLQFSEEINMFLEQIIKIFLKKDNLSYEFYKNYKYLEILKNYLTNSITNNEYCFYKEKININEILSFSKKINIQLEENEIKFLSNMHKNMTEFYEEINYRNEKIIDNLLKQDKSKIKAIIIGGFHINGIKKYLLSKGTSFSLIIPNQELNKKTDILYKNRLLNQNSYIKSINRNFFKHEKINNNFLNAISLFFDLRENNKDYLKKNSSYIENTEIYNIINESKNSNSYNINLEKLKNNTIFLLNILIKKSSQNLDIKDEKINKFLDEILENNSEKINIFNENKSKNNFEFEYEKQQKMVLDFYKFIKLSTKKYIESNNNNEIENNFLKSLQKNQKLIIKKHIPLKNEKNKIFSNIYKNIDNLFINENKNEKIDLFLYSEEDILFFNNLKEIEKEEYIFYLNKMIEQDLQTNSQKNLNKILKNTNYFPKKNIYKTKKNLNIFKVQKFWEKKKNKKIFSKTTVFFRKIINFFKKIIFYAPPDGYDDTMQIIRSFKIPELLANIGATFLYLLGFIVLGIFSFKAIKSLHETRKKEGIINLNFLKELIETVALILMAIGMVLAIIGIWVLKTIFKVFTHIALLISNIFMIISNLINIFHNIKTEYNEKIKQIDNSNISQISKERYRNFAKIDKNIDYILSVAMIIFQLCMAVGICIIIFSNPISSIISGLTIILLESKISSIFLIIGGIGTIIVLIFKFGFVETNKKRKEIPFDESDEIENDKILNKNINYNKNEIEINKNKNLDENKIQNLVDKYIFKIAYKNKFFKKKKLEIKYFEKQLKKSGLFAYFYRIIEQDISMQYMDKYIKKSLNKIILNLENLNFFENENKNIYFNRNQKIGNIILLIMFLIVVNVLAAFFTPYIFLGNIIVIALFFVIINKIIEKRKEDFVKNLDIYYKKFFFKFLLDVEDSDPKKYIINLLNSINEITDNNFKEKIKNNKNFYFLINYLNSNNSKDFNNINFDFIYENDKDFEKIYENFINYCFNYLLNKKTDIFFKKKIFISLNENNKENSKISENSSEFNNENYLDNEINSNNNLKIYFSSEKNLNFINQSLNEIYLNDSKNKDILLFIKDKINEFLNIKKEKNIFGKNIKNFEIKIEKNVKDFFVIEKADSIIINLDENLFENLKKLENLEKFKGNSKNKNNLYLFLSEIFCNILKKEFKINGNNIKSLIEFLESIKKITRFKSYFMFKNEEINNSITILANLLNVDIEEILKLYDIENFCINESIIDTEKINLEKIKNFLDDFLKNINDNKIIKIIFLLNKNDLNFLNELLKIFEKYKKSKFLKFEIIFDENICDLLIENNHEYENVKFLKNNKEYLKFYSKLLNGSILKNIKKENLIFYMNKFNFLENNFYPGDETKGKYNINKNIDKIIVSEYIPYYKIINLKEYENDNFYIKKSINLELDEDYEDEKINNINNLLKINDRTKNNLLNIKEKNQKIYFIKRSINKIFKNKKFSINLNLSIDIEKISKFQSAI